MHRYILPMALLALSGITAAADNGVYLGAGIVTSASLDGGRFVADLKPSDKSLKLTVGVRPVDYFGIEATHSDLGSTGWVTVATDAQVRASARFTNAFAVGYLPLPAVDLYAKAGLSRWDARVQLATIAGPQPEVTANGTDVAYGLGAQLRFGSLAARLEYERVEVSQSNRVDGVSLGVTWTFF